MSDRLRPALRALVDGHDDDPCTAHGEGQACCIDTTVALLLGDPCRPNTHYIIGGGTEAHCALHTSERWPCPKAHEPRGVERMQA